MTITEIVEDYLKENDYDGLYNDDGCWGEDGCGCFLGDLFPCDPEWCDIRNCRPGVRKEGLTGINYISPREGDE